jgi:nucleotide-binding universal stress UspA family protein
MYRFKKILVGLGNNEHDPVILKYAGWISRMAKSQKMILFHAYEGPDTFSCLPSEYAECFLHPEPFSRDKMEELARKSLDGYPEMVKECQTVEGDAFVEMIQKIRGEDIDLVILGRKTGKESNRNLPMKLARKAPCSVWVIPEGAQGSIGNVLAPVDFSENSRDALEIALSIASAGNLGALPVPHVFKVPIGYHKSGKTYEEFAKIMKRNARDEYKEFTKGMDLKGVKVSPLFILNDNPAKALQGVAKRKKADLIVIGAKGRSFAALVLLGSVTEKLIATTHVPILAVKKKGSGMGFLEALLAH